MRGIRALFITLIVIGAACAIDRLAIAPFLCERVKGAATKRADRVALIANDDAKTVAARETREMIAGCTTRFPNDIDLLLLIAFCYRAEGRYDDALAVYRRAIAIEERPEIDFMIGATLLESKRRQESIASFFRAAQWNHELMYDIADRDILLAVRQRVVEYEDRLRGAARR